MQCLSCIGIEGVECQGGIANIFNAYHGAVEVRRSLLGAIEVHLTTQRCPDGYCRGVNTSSFNDVDISNFVYSGRSDPVTFAIPGQCSDYRDQSPESSLCGRCIEDFAPPDVGSSYLGCVECKGASHLKLGMLIGISWLLVIVYYVASNGRLGVISSFLYYVQTIAIMVSSQSSLTAWFRTFGFSPVSVMPSVCFAPMTPELQYAIPLFIAPMQIIMLALTVLVHYCAKRYCISSPYELDELSMTYVMSREQLFVFERERRCRLSLQSLCMFIRYRLWPELTISTIVRKLFLIITASFTSVMVTCMSWFSCTSDFPVGVAGAHSSVVYSFPAISCYSKAYIGWSWLMGACILLWMLIIALSTWWLATHRQQLVILQSRSTASSGVPSDRRIVALSSLALQPRVPVRESQCKLVDSIHQTNRFYMVLASSTTYKHY